MNPLAFFIDVDGTLNDAQPNDTLDWCDVNTYAQFCLRPGAKEAVRMLLGQGHTVHFVTAANLDGPDRCTPEENLAILEFKREWLRTQLTLRDVCVLESWQPGQWIPKGFTDGCIERQPIWLIGAGRGEQRAKLCKGPTDVLIDDELENIATWSGIPVFFGDDRLLLSAGLEEDIALPPNIWSFQDWASLSQIVKAIQGGVSETELDWLWEKLESLPQFPEKEKTREMFFEMMGALQLFSRKQADYSAANIKIAGEYGLYTRITDKWARLFSHYGLGKTLLNESLDDTFRDMAVYALIALLLRNGKWNLNEEERQALGAAAGIDSEEDA